MRQYGKLALLAFFCLIQWVSGEYGFGTDGMRTVRFDLNLTWEDYDGAGFTRKAILSNGQLPAPTLRLRQGDIVEFVVKNQMPYSTTVHFHGKPPPRPRLVRLV